MISPLRFFAVAPLHSPYMLMALAAVALSGIVMLIIDPGKGAQALGPLALLQMLAASTGFAVGARHGHLDLLLTGGSGRVAVAFTHLGLSVLPGVLVWLGLGLVEMLGDRTLAPRALASGTLVALGTISVLAWALTVRLPRSSGGMVWLLGISVWLVGWAPGGDVAAALNQSSAGYPTRALIVTLCPFLLLGRRLSSEELLAAVPLIGLASLLTASAVIWIARMDVPLESAQ